MTDPYHIIGGTQLVLNITQTRTPCPSCREQRAGPSSSSICLRAQLISPHPSLHLSFLAAHGGGWGDLILPKDPAEGS